jgi:flagellar biosynthesis protein FliP
MAANAVQFDRLSALRAARRRVRGAALALAALALCGGLAVAPAAGQVPDAGGGAVQAVEKGFTLPTFPFLKQTTEKDSFSTTVQIVVLMTVLTIAPSILLMMTSFVRMLIVLVLLRQALGTQQLPPSQVLVGLALFMTLLVMTPTWQRVKAEALDPYLDDKISQQDAIVAAGRHLRDYMFKQIENAGNEEDVYMMYEYAEQRAVPDAEALTKEQVPLTALIPAFMLSELKTSFVLGFKIYLPFLVIDMVIATVLVSMGMMMLPPVLISLPFKLLLFVLADGWHLIGGSLMASVQ